MTSDTGLTLLTAAFITTVFNVLLIHPRASVMFLLMRFSGSCRDDFIFRGVVCTGCSVCEFDTIFKLVVGHFTVYKVTRDLLMTEERKSHFLHQSLLKMKITMVSHLDWLIKDQNKGKRLSHH